MDKKRLGKRIKIARIEKGMTQIELSNEICVMQKSISKYESGIVMPTLETLENLSIVLDKPFSYFLEDK